MLWESDPLQQGSTAMAICVIKIQPLVREVPPGGCDPQQFFGVIPHCIIGSGFFIPKEEIHHSWGLTCSSESECKTPLRNIPELSGHLELQVSE